LDAKWIQQYSDAQHRKDDHLFPSVAELTSN